MLEQDQRTTPIARRLLVDRVEVAAAEPSQTPQTTSKEKRQNSVSSTDNLGWRISKKKKKESATKSDDNEDTPSSDEE